MAAMELDSPRVLAIIIRTFMASPSSEPPQLAEIPGVGPKGAEVLTKLGVVTYDDLLHYVPNRYEDRRHLKPLNEAQVGEAITFRGKIHSAKTTFWRGRGQVFEIMVAPAAVTQKEEMVRGCWFKMFFLPKILTPGRELFLHGKLTKSKSGTWAMMFPEFELIENDANSFIHTERIVPVYSLTQGVNQPRLRQLMFEATQKFAIQAPEFYPFPKQMMRRDEAFRTIHFPDAFAAEERARQRLAYDEFFVLQCVVAQRRLSRALLHRNRPPHGSDLSQRWRKALPYTLTNAQQRVMGEIDSDLSHGAPMNRLLQGDVGSGKTFVGVYAMLRAVEAGEQAALMAPTQILAEQHALNLRAWLEPLGIRVDLFTGNTKPKKADRLEGGELDFNRTKGELPQAVKPVGSIVVGTHALLYDRYAADKLGLIVIDEQHKFGVLQRLALSRKGQNPDILVMTATPIPRTLGMTLYGDLDVSVLDELPPGRQPIDTRLRSQKDLENFWKFLLQQIGRGRQAYIVYALVEESEKVEAKSVKAEFERLKGILPQVRIGLLYGQLDGAEKERVMTAFRAGNLDVLVSTSVIEVGVDVPNATIMLIENAERFGLAQLHQLRGRIGRGEHSSVCVLMGEPKSLESWRRLKIMEETQDGFRIAEEDFNIRGPGNIFSTEQSGIPPMRFGDLQKDFDLLTQARNEAAQFIKEDPTLAKWPGLQKRTQQGGIAAVSLVTVS
jgi:ATP-dependent DNA helicase RecG